MRAIFVISLGVVGLVGVGLQACSSGSSGSGFGLNGGDGGSSGSSGGSSSGSTSSSGGTASSSGGGSSSGLAGDGGTTPLDGGSVTTVYANTDNTLYSMDPSTKTATAIGPMVGTSDSSTDSTLTDVAVNGAGDVYVNSESKVYKATLPTGGTGTVQLTVVATIQSTAKFFALAFAPAGALDASNETLVGGDSTGTLSAIATSGGKTTTLGNFGPDPSISGNTFELSGDLVFYLDSKTQAPTGLATIRSCPSGGSGSTCKGDYLAAVNMTALKAAYTGGAGGSLLAGIYGGTAASPGAGIGFVDVFGLAAWNATVFGFTRYTSKAAPTLITIDATTGAGTQVQTFSFTGNDGWSGAGVTTKVNIIVPPPAQ